MKFKKLSILGVAGLLTGGLIYAASTTTITADFFRSSDRTKTQTLPSASGTLLNDGSSLNASKLSSGTVPAAQLPNPGVSTLGGIESYAAVTNQWINAISTSGVPSSAQPAFSNISGSVAASQLPNPSASTLGGVESIAGVSHNFLTSISTSGVLAQAQPAFTDVSGTATATQGGTAQSSWTAGDLLYASASNTLSKLPIGSSGQGLVVTAGLLPAWGTATSVGAFNVKTKTTTYTAIANDLISATAASAWSLTLPTAVGVAGQLIVVQRTDNVPAQLISVITTSSQTINGLSTVHLATQNEVWTFKSDGANWLAHHESETPWTSFTMTITGTSTLPSFSTGVAVNAASWKRRGQDMMVMFEYDSTGGSGGANGGGCYLWALPNSTLDSGLVTFNTDITLFGKGSNLGHGIAGGSASSRSGDVTAYDSTHVMMSYGASGSCWGSATTAIITSGGAHGTFQWEGPITNWEN